MDKDPLPDSEVLGHYKGLLTVMVGVVNTRMNKPILPGEEWENDAQVLSLKVFGHLLAVGHLAHGMRFPLEKEQHFAAYDFASAIAVGRAALESFLVFNFIYADEDVAVRKFRYTAWRLSGLADRCEMIPLSEESRRKIEDEEIALEPLRESLRASPVWQRCPPKHREKLLAGRRNNWRPGTGWADLAEKAGMSRKFFTHVYGYYCGHAHSSWASIVQIRDSARLLEDQRSLALTVVRLSAVVAGLFIEKYCSLFEAGQRQLDAHPGHRQHARLWAGIARGVDELFDKAGSAGAIVIDRKRPGGVGAAG